MGNLEKQYVHGYPASTVEFRSCGELRNFGKPNLTFVSGNY